MSKKVLICDDEEGIRESLKLILADHFELIIADNPESAIEIIKNSKDIKVALLDIKMPKINGLEVLKAMKKHRPDVKIIMVTGYRSVETAAEATALGADGYIIKPFNAKEIIDGIKKHI